MRYALQKSERTESKALSAFSLQVLESRVSCLQKNRLRALLTSIPAGVSLRSTLKTVQASLTDFFHILQPEVVCAVVYLPGHQMTKDYIFHSPSYCYFFVIIFVEVRPNFFPKTCIL